MDKGLYSCLYCNIKPQNFPVTIQHTITEHPCKKLKVKRRIGLENCIKNFQVVPELCREQGRYIFINTENESIHISSAHVVPKDSPYKKICKLNDRSRSDNEISDKCSDINRPCGSEENDCEIELVGLGDMDVDERNDSDKTRTQELDETIASLTSLLPMVVENLKTANKLEEFISFNRLMSEKRFPMENIAFLLFLDVVRWYNLNDTTTLMR